MKLLSSQIAGLLADSVNDADSTRKVYLLAAGLAGLGIALIAITVWFWRNTRHDPELLAPLEVMGEKAFVKLDGKARQQILDAARPPDAEPMRWGVIRGETDLPQEIVDLRPINRAGDAGGYDDLRESPDAGPPVAESSVVDSVVVDAVAVDAVAVESSDVVAEAVAVEPSPAEASASNAGASVADTIAESAESKADSTAETVLDEFAIIDAGRVAQVEPTPQKAPLLIVPVDHELRITTGRSPGRAGDRPGSTAPGRTHPPDRAQTPDPVETVTPETAVKPSIDPLLRKFDRDDS